MTRQRSAFDLMRREDRAAHIRKQFSKLSRLWPGQPIVLFVVAHEGTEQAQEFVHILGTQGHEEEYLLALVASKATRKFGAKKVTGVVAKAIEENRRRVFIPGGDA